MMPSALLLDLDGTLVDSEPRHIRAHQKFLASVGIPIGLDIAAANIGKGDRAFYRTLMAERGVTGDADAWVAAKTDILMDLYRTEGLPLQPGVKRLLAQAAADGVFCHIVTSAERRLCVLSLEVTGLAQRLPTRICHEDVLRHKPNPEPYLLAASRLSLPPERCWVIEDSATGVRSGVAAGCHVIAVAGLVPAADLKAAGAHEIVTTLESVGW